ncbi:hypothetical protein PR202_gb26838 [Eleusine coracana subsp. coracana]|uniref:DUF6598 domain-containing protein n=1 Tax=Eleusine coracana subsp. coracana TaxID=191504 RepID=A0AAV5FTH2_ELECO|nr:hypothetical protein PR202_gb26838 [Eleusine coracana subsp. coracana]
MYETKLKKYRRWALHTANKDCDGGEDDVTTLPEGHGDGSKDGSSSGSDDHDGHEDHGAASEDSDDGFGPRVVQLLAIRANFSVRSIYATDWIQPRHIYSACKGEVQEEGMVDLILTGPSRSLQAYGGLYLKVFTADDEGSCTSPPIIGEWDVTEDEEVAEYTQTIDGGPGRKLEITYLVISGSVEANVEVELNLKDLGSGGRSVYGSIKASAIGYGSKSSIHLFSCERGRSLSVPCGSTSDLPLSLDMIALPYFSYSRPHFKLHLEVDLRVITSCGSQEEDKNLNFYLEFTRGTRSLEREADGDQVEVNVTWCLNGY